MRSYDKIPMAFREGVKYGTTPEGEAFAAIQFGVSGEPWDPEGNPAREEQNKTMAVALFEYVKGMVKG